jgi:hypothetical protein
MAVTKEAGESSVEDCPGTANRSTTRTTQIGSFKSTARNVRNHDIFQQALIAQFCSFYKMEFNTALRLFCKEKLKQRQLHINTEPFEHDTLAIELGFEKSFVRCNKPGWFFRCITPLDVPGKIADEISGLLQHHKADEVFLYFTSQQFSGKSLPLSVRIHLPQLCPVIDCKQCQTCQIVDFVAVDSYPFFN